MLDVEITKDLGELEIEILNKYKPPTLIETESKQITKKINEMNETVLPFYPPSSLLAWTQLNTRLKRSIKILARNLAGLGFTINSRLDKDDMLRKAAEGDFDLESYKKIVKEQKKKVEDFFNECNPEESFSTILFRDEINRQTFGFCFLELCRNEQGELKRIYLVPPQTVLVRKDGNLKIGYVQEIDGVIRYFKVFGDPSIVDMETGVNLTEEFKKKAKGLPNLADNYTITLSDGSQLLINSPEELPYERRASELIMRVIYCPLDLNYGVPCWNTTFRSLSGRYNAATRNDAFFRNDGVPRSLIVIKNGRLNSEMYQQLYEFINQGGQGPDKAHRTLIVQAKKNINSGTKSNVEIDVHKLTVGQDEDMTFSKYCTFSDEDVRESFGIAKLFYGTADDVNRSSSLVLRQIFNQQEISPEQEELEKIINKQIIHSEFGLNCKEVVFKLIKPKSTDDLDLALIYGNLSNMGAVTPNHVRKHFGWEEYPESEEWANQPFPVTLKQIASTGAISDISTGQQDNNLVQRDQASEVAKPEEKPQGSYQTSLSKLDTINKSLDELLKYKDILEKSSELNQMDAIIEKLIEKLQKNS